MFNEDQKEYMTYLSILKPEEKCYCGWYLVGKCYNCPKEATLADRRKAKCPCCHNYPQFGKTEITHNIKCKINTIGKINV